MNTQVIHVLGRREPFYQVLAPDARCHGCRRPVTGGTHMVCRDCVARLAFRHYYGLEPIWPAPDEET